MDKGPKINWQYQDLHNPESAEDWVSIQRVEADICLFYHQQSNYSYIMGDLYYGDVYALPYWEFLQTKNLPNDRADFIQSGCLMIILAMCWELIYGSGTYLAAHIDEAGARTRGLEPASDQVARLQSHALRALESASGSDEVGQDFAEESAWAHTEFVMGYFRSICADFDNNPYFKKSQSEQAGCQALTLQ